MEQYIVSKQGVPNSHGISWHNAVKAIDQERYLASQKLKKFMASR